MAKRLFVGTMNQAKVQMIAAALAPLAVTVSTFPRGTALPTVEENGRTAVDNARIKSLAYMNVAEAPVLSMDNALYLEGLPESQQPGVNTRRIVGNGGDVTDDEMLEFYVALIGGLGGTASGKWQFGVSIAFPDGRLAETSIDMPRIFVDRPSVKRIPGYPLESIQHDHSGKYVSELSRAEQDSFWRMTVGVELRVFVRNALALDADRLAA